MRTLLSVFVVTLVSCGPAPVGPVVGGGAGGSGGGGAMAGGGGGTSDAGDLDAGETNDAGSDDAGNSSDAGEPADAGSDAGTTVLPDLGWNVIGIPGSQCALGSQAGIAYNSGSTDELMIFLQGGGACWNNGTCHPSLFRWGPVCNYGSDSICAWDDSGGTKPLAVNVEHPDPFPADGGGQWTSDLGSVQSSLLFTRRIENPLKNATYVYVPYCTGDLHAGDATRTYHKKAQLFDTPVAVTHHFAGATNMDAYLAYLRTRHPSVRVIYLTGLSGGGYGASLNVARVRAVFPEAKVHLLADSAPMLQTNFFPTWSAEWNLQLPAACADCDAGFPQIIQHQIDADPSARVALLSFSQDPVITRFFYSGGSTNSWLNPPFGTYTTNLVMLESQYESTSNARYFRLAGQEHVMMQKYGVVQSDGGISAPASSPDGGTHLKAWIDAWATGTGAWDNLK